MYDGVLEKVVADMMNDMNNELHITCYSETENPVVFKFASTQLKDKLLEAGICKTKTKQIDVATNYSN